MCTFMIRIRKDISLANIWLEFLVSSQTFAFFPFCLEFLADGSSASSQEKVSALSVLRPAWYLLWKERSGSPAAGCLRITALASAFLGPKHPGLDNDMFQDFRSHSDF